MLTLVPSGPTSLPSILFKNSWQPKPADSTNRPTENVSASHTSNGDIGRRNCCLFGDVFKPDGSVLYRRVCLDDFVKDHPYVIGTTIWMWGDVQWPDGTKFVAYRTDRSSDTNDAGMNISTASISNDTASFFNNEAVAIYASSHTEIYTPKDGNVVTTNSIGSYISTKV